MNLSNTFNEGILNELRKGNMEALKGLPPVLVMQYGIALQNEQGYKEPSPINDNELGTAMLSRIADTGIRESLVKQIEQEEKERAKETTKEIAG